MKALVHGTRVCEVAPEEFPVADPLQWYDCDDTVTTQHTFDGTRFIAPRPSKWHDLVDGHWVIPPQNAAAAHNEMIDEQVKQTEEQNPFKHRALREGLYALPVLADLMTAVLAQIEAEIRTIPGHETFTLQRLPDLKKNSGMKRIKAADDAIRALLAQRLP